MDVATKNPQQHPTSQQTTTRRQMAPHGQWVGEDQMRNSRRRSKAKYDQVIQKALDPKQLAAIHTRCLEVIESHIYIYIQKFSRFPQISKSFQCFSTSRIPHLHRRNLGGFETPHRRCETHSPETFRKNNRSKPVFLYIYSL